MLSKPLSVQFLRKRSELSDPSQELFQWVRLCLQIASQLPQGKLA